MCGKFATLNIIHADRGLLAYGCNYLGIYGLTLNRTVQGTGQMIVIEGTNLSLSSCAIQASAVQTNDFAYGIYAVLSNVFFSNGAIKRISNMNAAIYAVSSYVTTRAITGTGNNRGYVASGGIILTHDTMPSATTPFVKNNGGQISDNGVWIA